MRAAALQRAYDSLEARIAALRTEGVGVAIVDATSNEDLLRLGPALKGMPLVTAGSGVAIGLPANWGIAPSSTASALPPAQGLRAIVSGSCSLATNRQVAHFRAQGGPALALDPLQLSGDTGALVREVLAWAQPRLARGPVLVYSTAAPEAVQAIQARLGVAEAGALVEHALASVARALADKGQDLDDKLWQRGAELGWTLLCTVAFGGAFLLLHLTWMRVVGDDAWVLLAGSFAFFIGLVGLGVAATSRLRWWPRRKS